jgi:hypothetical protein
VIGDGNSSLGEDGLVVRLNKIESALVFRSRVLARLGDEGAKFVNGWHDSLREILRPPV